MTISLNEDQSSQKTTSWQAFIHLLKGYVGPGCLSLPWAVSQLGLPLGVTVVFSVSCWTSVNIWHVVQLKREYEKTLPPSTTTTTTTQQQITYPDVGAWLYGNKFGLVLKAMICVQQISVCTVFLSFIGENLGAAIRNTLGPISHIAVISLALPAALALVCLPNLKVLAPVMTLATLTLFGGFAVLGVLIWEQWPDRPQNPPIQIQDWGQLPLAICAVLYAFEGICLILPIETSMANKEKFGHVFSAAMTASAVIFALVASLCVMAFGSVSSGSITAFLVEKAEGDDLTLLYAANTLVSVAVLLTYPLQLFPSYELVGPTIAKYFTSPSTNTTSQSSIEVDNHGHAYIAANEEEPQQQQQQQDSQDEDTLPQSSLNEAPFLDEPEDEEETIQETTTRSNEHMQQEFNYWHYFGTSYGDTPAVRAGLVMVTYLFAIIIPNVQLLVSLAGAVSGSATGLLVPPLLQLANWKRLERQETLAEETTTDGNFGPWYYQQRRMNCYVLLFMGTLVLIIGTGASLRDIIRVYMGWDTATEQ